MADYTPLDGTTKWRVRTWMTREIALGDEPYANSTLLAEACGDALGLAAADVECTIPEEVYDIALEFFEED